MFCISGSVFVPLPNIFYTISLQQTHNKYCFLRFKLYLLVAETILIICGHVSLTFQHQTCFFFWCSFVSDGGDDVVSVWWCVQNNQSSMMTGSEAVKTLIKTSGRKQNNLQEGIWTVRPEYDRLHVRFTLIIYKGKGKMSVFPEQNSASQLNQANVYFYAAELNAAEIMKLLQRSGGIEAAPVFLNRKLLQWLYVSEKNRNVIEQQGGCRLYKPWIFGLKTHLTISPTYDTTYDAHSDKIKLPATKKDTLLCFCPSFYGLHRAVLFLDSSSAFLLLVRSLW